LKDKKAINIVLGLLKQFSEGRLVSLNREQRQSAQIVRYYNEIIRFWSKLNFVIKKTLRSLKLATEVNHQENAIYLYATYRCMFEAAPIRSILDELNISNESIKIRDFLNKILTFSWKTALEGKSKQEKLSIEEAIPSFFIESLVPVISFNFLKENIKHMNDIKKQSDFTVRFNDLSGETPKIDLIERIITSLESKGVILVQDQEIAELYHVSSNNKSTLIKNDWYQKGNLIIQDKASAIIVKALDPKPNELICDMCAAPGMKTSLIAQYTGNRSKIIAGEYLPDRTYLLRDVLDRLNVQNKSLITTDSIEFPLRFEEHFDRVLLDAPCTGSGTFLANPELKWRQSEKFLHQNVTLQKKLLGKAIKMLKPNGILVFSTCSLYQEEGEKQLLDLQDKLIPLDLQEWCSPSYEINGSKIPGTGRLFPSIHSTQGFFIGKFKKKE